MTIIAATEARRTLYALIDQSAETHEPIHITGKRSNAVLIAESDWAAIQETLYLLGIPGMRESLLEAKKTPLSKCSTAIKW
jgi:antitoxin YefM